jgi:hypothetical protein
MLNFKPAFPFILLMTLAACGAPDMRFPSLERRAYEADAPLLTALDSPVAPSILSDDLAAKAVALRARHDAAHTAYMRGRAAVQAIASKAAGRSPGSEDWVNAHVMLSRLDRMRADSVGALRDFDGLIADAGARDVGMAALLADAQLPIAHDVAAQNVEIAQLSRLIGE